MLKLITNESGEVLPERKPHRGQPLTLAEVNAVRAKSGLAPVSAEDHAGFAAFHALLRGRCDGSYSRLTEPACTDGAPLLFLGKEWNAPVGAVIARVNRALEVVYG